MKKIYLGLIILSCLFSVNSKAQCTTPSLVPYSEGFNTISGNNDLPPCWAASNMSVTCLTYAIGNGIASFSCLPAGTSYFYSNAIQLSAGITYSMSAMYKLMSGVSNDWTNFSLNLATGQSALGMVSVAVSGPVSTAVFSILSNTFNVPSTGVYYAVIEAKSTGASGTADLAWDDLEITIPCSLNTTSVTIAASALTVCAGGSITFTASGADTYTWSGGSASGSSNTLTVFPIGNVDYTVVGTNSLTTCTDSSSVSITTFSAPLITFTSSALTPTICNGDVVTVNVTGANTYVWNWYGGAAIGSTVNISPYITTTVSIKGTGDNNCSSITEYVLNVKTCTGLKGISGPSILKIYPNPGKGEFNIETGNNELKSILITDLVGKIIFSSSTKEEVISIDIRDLSKGVYQVKVSSGMESNYMKIVKE